MSRTDHPELYAAKDDFARRYLGRDQGVYSVGIGRDDEGFCLRVSCSAERLESLPVEHQGVRVIARLGAPGIVCI